MNKDLCTMVVEHKKTFIPSLFTKRQITILEKYLGKEFLTNTEKAYLYSTITRKIDALQVIREEYYIKGDAMIPGRVERAKQILKELNYDKVFISGSFLYAEVYNDIDIYVIGKRRKQYRKGKRHFIHLVEADLQIPLFASAAQYSVSTFFIPKFIVAKKRNLLDETILAYELAVKEILDKEDPKTLKDILLAYSLLMDGKLLDSYELYKSVQEIKKSSDPIGRINEMTRKIILSSYSHRYLYDVLVKFTRILSKTIKEYSASRNLIIYRNLFNEIKNECRTVKA